MSYCDGQPGGAELLAGAPEGPDGKRMKGTASTVSSGLSMKSGCSRKSPPNIREDRKRNHMEGPGSTVSSGISMRSDWSKDPPLNFRGEGQSCASVDSGYIPSASASSAAVVWEQCDVCFEAALKICLTCMASYCMSHVRDHYRSPDLQTHQLENLQHQGVCDQHHKQHEFFCRTDQSAICSHCLLHNHKEHDVIEQIPEGAQSTRKGVPPPGPIQFSSVQSDSVTLSWSPPEGAPEALSYRVSRRRGQELRSFKVASLGLEVTDLIPGEMYHFAVASLSADGYQGPSVKGSVRTEVPPPENLSLDLRSLKAFLTWTKPAGVDQVSYLLELFRGQEHINTISRDALQHTFTGLQYGTDYTIRVSTVLSNSHQSKPIPKTFRTEVPPPEKFTVEVSLVSASLKWTKPAGVDQVSYLLELVRGQECINTLSTDDLHHTITGLQYGTYYTIRVSTVLSNGRQSKPTCLPFYTEGLRIMLLGKIGVGKSESGNIILRRDAFVDAFSPHARTQHCCLARAEVGGRLLCVMDTPGLLDTDHSEAESMQEIKKCISLSSSGPHVLLLVLRLDCRFTQEEQESVKYIQSIFGEESAKYTIVLFTHGDYLEKEGVTIDEIISTNTSFRELVAQYHGRYHVFNNTDITNYSQVKELLNKIDQMVTANGGNYYTRSRSASDPPLSRGVS